MCPLSNDGTPLGGYASGHRFPTQEKNTVGKREGNCVHKNALPSRENKLSDLIMYLGPHFLKGNPTMGINVA